MSVIKCHLPDIKYFILPKIKCSMLESKVKKYTGGFISKKCFHKNT